MKIAFLDTLGLEYDGNTLNDRGLGGSESACILLSKELAKIGFDVTVFCKVDQVGIYDNVRYLNKSEAQNTQELFDILISLRSCVPFIPIQYRDTVLNTEGQDIASTYSLVQNSKYKVIWCHDYFIRGDNWLEGLLLDGFVDEVFTLSDFHSQYISGGHFFRHRYSEVIQDKIWQTRNGINAIPFEEINIQAKDKNLFCFNASISKGMECLVEQIWGKVKERIPNAKLYIIGGYYHSAGNNSQPDKQELDYFKLVDKYNNKNDIIFTGIIKQSEISNILTKASYMIYPASGHPETFGISTLESLAHNTPVITCKFGSLNETAVDSASYKINYNLDYQSQCNSDGEIIYNQDQINRFVDLVCKAYNDNLLRQQKMYVCNELKPFITWDTIAKQWKQHIYNKLNLYLPIEEIREVRNINREVQRIFKRRFLNPEDVFEYNPSKIENRIIIISPFYNSGKYLENCIRSVASQDYDNYLHFFINDMSNDNSLKIIEDTVLSLSENLRNKFFTVNNSTKKYALRNQVETINNFSQNSNDIIILLDGDDWLINDPDIFNCINNQYINGAEMTYGSCHSLVDNIDLISQPYPEKVHQDKSYRSHLFNWGLPYTHLRTFKKEVFDRISIENFLDENNEFYKAGSDNALFYALLENCNNYHNIKCIQRVLYIYNDTNPLNDYKINSIEQNKNAENIRKMDTIIDMKKTDDVYKIKDEIVNDVRQGNEKAIQIYKDIASNRQDVWIDDINSMYLAPRRDWLLEKLRNITKDNKNIKILDIGSWTGAISNFIYQNGYQNITCIDISEKVVDLGKNQFPYFNWICADIEDYINSEKYDVILMCEVLEHVIDPKKVIAKVCTWLNKNGCILYTIPSEDTVFGEKMGNNSSEHISKIEYNYLTTISDDIERLHTYNDGKLTYDWYTGSIYNKINILIALPTAKYIEADTFKSIYRLEKSNNCNIHMECFYGYRIDQVRNLICDYAINNNFDYVFFVDSDIILPSDALVKLLNHSKDIVSGTYIQRKQGIKIPEIYIDINSNIQNINIDDLNKHNNIFEIAGCGFGCCLVKVDSIKKINYPQFEYHPAIKMENTLSEDIDFCIKAKNKGINIFCDPSIKCDHIGTNIFKI